MTNHLLILSDYIPHLVIGVGSIIVLISSFLDGSGVFILLGLLMLVSSALIIRRAWHRFWFEEELRDLLLRLKKVGFSKGVYFNYAITGRDRRLALAFSDAVKANDRRFRSIIRERIGEEAVLRSMDEAVIVLDLDDRIVQINRAAEDLFSISSKNVIGRTVQEVIMLAPLHRFIKQVQRSEEHEQEGDLSILSSKDRYLQMTGSRVIDRDGTALGLIVVFNDVTKMRSLERARTDFIANVSHELKTPITSIRGFGETLLDGALSNPADAKRFVGIIVKQAERLGRIFDDMLTLSRLEGGVVSDKSRQNIRALLVSVVQTCEIVAKAKEASVSISCEEALEAEINPPLFEQALINLVENAIKYSPPSSSVLLKAELTASNLTVSVVDNGPGIEASHLARIFERFYRVDKGRSRAEGGTGLGLAIVKHIAQAHGGAAYVESELGKGSKFTIEVPTGTLNR